MAIESGVLENKKVVELLNSFIMEPNIKVLMEPIKNMLKAKESINFELELVSLQLILDVKNGKTISFKSVEGLDVKALKTKLAKLVNKTVITNAIESAELLLKAEDLEEKYLGILNSLREGFIDLREDKKLKQANKDENSSKSGEAGSYDNPNFKEVIIQFESNESIVYLLNLVSRSFAEDLFLARANRVVASLEILSSIREEGDNPLIHFGKMTLEELRKKMKGSVSEEIVDICLTSGFALFERIGDVEGATAALKNTIKDLKARLITIKQKFKES